MDIGASRRMKGEVNYRVVEGERALRSLRELWKNWKIIQEGENEIEYIFVSTVLYGFKMWKLNSKMKKKKCGFGNERILSCPYIHIKVCKDKRCVTVGEISAERENQGVLR